LPRLTRPLVFFDLETTGTNLGKDRVVEVAMVRVEPDGARVEFNQRVNPGVPIPPSSTEIHGISDADVKDMPPFQEVAPRVAALLKDADVAGYNIRRFDIPLLEEEFRRVGVDWKQGDAKVVDAYEVFQKYVSHSLEGAVRFYCNRSHQDAHSAMADVVATMDVLSAQVERYPDLPRDVEALAAAVVPARVEKQVDPQGKLVKTTTGEIAINFGQHKGQTLSQMAKSHPDYLRWILAKDFHPSVMEAVRAALDAAPPVRPGPPSRKKG
jgi:DNA polymerase-3 subunit epsilon